MIKHISKWDRDTKLKWLVNFLKKNLKVEYVGLLNTEVSKKIMEIHSDHLSDEELTVLAITTTPEYSAKVENMKEEVKKFLRSIYAAHNA